MRRDNQWWQASTVREELERALSRINTARYSPHEDDITRCGYLFNALNTLWTAHRRAANPRRARNDQAVKDPLTAGIPPRRQQWFCKSPSVYQLATVEPRILNHRTVTESQQNKPNRDIPSALAHKASKEHRQLAEAMARWKSAPSDENRVTLLVKVATMLYMVRSNIAQGRKPPLGGNQGKTERDRQVCAITKPVLTALFEALFNFPAKRLAVYGTLAPGEVNHHMLAGIPGKWENGSIQGVLGNIGPYPAFRWEKPGREVSVKLFHSPHLKNHWERLDRFEGCSYRRILLPVQRATGGVVVATLYEAAGKMRSLEPRGRERPGGKHRKALGVTAGQGNDKRE